jgi:hypothetical protein
LARIEVGSVWIFDYTDGLVAKDLVVGPVWIPAVAASNDLVVSAVNTNP